MSRFFILFFFFFDELSGEVIKVIQYASIIHCTLRGV